MTASKDWKSGKMRVEFEIDEESFVREIETIEGTLTIKADKKRKRRSIDSNAYAWTLMQKIAEATHTDKWEVYLVSLQRYSRAFTHIIVKPNAVERTKEIFRTVVDLGEVSVNGQSGHQLQVYFGSSTFDTKEMSVFLDGIVSECKTLGIETLTPEELARMKAEWRSE